MKPTAWPRYILPSVLVLAAIVDVMIGLAFELPALAVGLMASVLVIAAVLSMRWLPWRREKVARRWEIFAVGALFLIGGFVGMIQSVQEGWPWIDRVPLLVPLSLGIYVIWFAFKARRRDVL